MPRKTFTQPFANRRVYTQKIFTNRPVYTQKALHRGPFTHNKKTTHRNTYTHTHTHIFTEKLLHTDAQIQFFLDKSSRHKKNGNENPLQSLGPKEFSGALFWPRGCSQRLPPYPPLFGKYVFACRRTFVTIPCRTNSLSCDLQNAELLLDQITIKFGNWKFIRGTVNHCEIYNFVSDGNLASILRNHCARVLIHNHLSIWRHILGA